MCKEGVLEGPEEVVEGVGVVGQVHQLPHQAGHTPPHRQHTQLLRPRKIQKFIYKKNCFYRKNKLTKNTI